jgi:hypothetical protein
MTLINTMGVTTSPSAIVGLVWDTVVVSCAINMGLLRPLLHLVRARCFTSSVVTPRGYKSRRSPLHTPTSSHTICHSLLTSFPTPRKKE